MSITETGSFFRMKFWTSFFLLLTFFCQVSWVCNAQSFDENYRRIDSLYHAGETEEVINLEQQILPQLGQRVDTLAANVLFYIGDAYMSGYDMDKAIRYFNRERDIRKQILPIDPDGYSNSLYNLMFVYLENGAADLAIEMGRELLEFDKSNYTINSEKYVWSAIDYFNVLLEVDRWSEAEAEARSLLAALSDDAKLRSLVETKLGLLYTYRGLYSKATRCYSNALPQMATTYGDSSEEYHISQADYANLLMAQGKYDLAEEILVNSLEIIRNANWLSRDQVYFAALNNLSIIYTLLGQFDRAQNILNTVLSNDSTTLGVDNPDFAISLSNLGQLYTDQARYAEAQTTLQQAIAILDANGESSSVSYARKLNNLARNYQYAGQVAQAVPLLERALKIFEDNLGKDSPEYATALLNLGMAQLATSPAAGYSNLKRAESLRRKLLGRKHPLYAESLEKLALYQWKKRNKKEVRRLMGAVFDNYFDQVSDFFPVLTEEEKANLFQNSIRPSQEIYASWVTDSGNSDPETLGELYTITINTKGLILYATDRVRQKILQSGDSSLIELYESWESQKELLAFYYSNNQNPAQVDSLLLVSQSTEKELARRSATFSRDIIRPQRNWKEIQSVLKPGEAALEIIRFKKYDVDSLKFRDAIHYACLILTSETKTGPKIVLLREGNLLENRYLSYYRNGIQFKVDDEYTYGYFWEPINRQLRSLGVEKLFLSPDGAYNLLSLPSIKNPETQKYLLEEFDIHLIGSTRDLLSTATKKSMGQSSLLIGYPQYNSNQKKDEKSVRSEQPVLMSRSIRGSLSRFLRGQNGIAELPGTKKEVELVSLELQKTHQPIVLLATEATEQRIKQTESPDILHIATHGYFLEDGTKQKTPNPLLNSGLILAGATDFIRSGENPLHAEDDGVLTAYEAMNLALDNTNLVVLSACETGLGTVQSGEGVYGLQRAFQLAGAKYIIMSLWPVDDEATQFLMSEFYQRWSKVDDIRLAFKEAQLETKARFGASYYWGAFVLVGI